MLRWEYMVHLPPEHDCVSFLLWMRRGWMRNVSRRCWLDWVWCPITHSLSHPAPRFIQERWWKSRRDGRSGNGVVVCWTGTDRQADIVFSNGRFAAIVKNSLSVLVLVCYRDNQMRLRWDPTASFLHLWSLVGSSVTPFVQQLLRWKVVESIALLVFKNKNKIRPFNSSKT